MPSIAACLNGAIDVDSEVTISAWARTRRDSKAGFSFLQCHDGSCFDPIQVVVPNDLANYESEVLKITAGCSVEVSGTLVASQGKGQAYEIQAKRVTVIGWVENPDQYPIQAKKHNFEFLREVAHLRPRTNTFGAVTRVRHCAQQAIHRFFDQQGFFWVNTPIITGSDCEGAGELFRVSTLDLLNPPKLPDGKIDFHEDFFHRETFLTVSGQLNAEAYACALSKVYTFGPTFRAENSNTSRHLAEFWMVEPEVAFTDLNGISDLAVSMLKYVCTNVLEQCSDDMAFFEKHIDDKCIARLNDIIEHDFEIMDYSDAITILENAKKSFEFPVRWGVDLQSEHERYIAEEYVGRPVVMQNYPKDIKGFYMRQNDDGKTVAAMDILAPGIGEIIGGSQREERYDVLLARLAELNLDPEHYQWYLDLRRYGSVPHAGFGLGFERLISYITGLSNVRDVIPFPRTPGNAQF